MGFIGNPPLQQGIALFSQDTFTGDGSTTTFDLTNAAPDGGDNVYHYHHHQVQHLSNQK